VAYTYERPDLRALAELEELFQNLGAEVATWRRRSLKAEAELQDIRAKGGVYEGPELSGAGGGEPGAPRADRGGQGAGPFAGRPAGLSRAGRDGGVTTPKNAVRVIIGGEEYTVRSELPPEYTREVAAYLDAALKRVRDSLPSVETHKAAILAALAITDELFQARRGDREIATRITAMADDLARLLPPAKRGSRVSGTLSVSE
jgi:cell division protein ZapA